MPSQSAFRLKTLVLATGLAMTTAAAAAAPAAAPVVAHATRLRAGDSYAGQLPTAQTMHVQLALKLRHRDELQSVIEAMHKGYAPMAGRAMEPDDFMQRYAPTADQAQAVADYLGRAGFANVSIAPNRLLVSADASVATVQAAFRTSLARIRTRDGRDAYANTSEAYLPDELKDSVLSVLGLQSVHQASTFARRLSARPQATGGVVTHNPTDFASIYGASGLATAAGVTVGILTQGSQTQTLTDLNTFTANNGLQPVATQVVDTNGTSTDTSNQDEWNLDTQDVVGAAGGQVGQLILYNTPSLLNTDLVANFNKIVSDNQAKIVNVSVGECEISAQDDGSAAAADQILQQAVAQGQTFSISTGDKGADECGDGGTSPEWPADSPFVVAVAGTLLSTNGATGYGTEVVWNDLQAFPGGGATGGSESTFESKPAFQDALFPAGSHRGVADVAFDASPESGANVTLDGAISVIGGTSLAAPIFSGLWARVLAIKGEGIGFAAPLLYQLPAADFHDVISGNNGGESAGVGYDLASGRGSLILSSAIKDLAGAGGAGTQLLGNPGFETGSAAPWNASSGVINSDSAEPPHSGSFDAWLDGFGQRHTDLLQQQVSIPAGKSSATLKFFLHIDTDETSSNQAFDTLSIQVLTSSGRVLANLGGFSNLDHNQGYAAHTADLSRFIGQNVVLRFTGSEDQSLQTSFVLDDVSLTVQ